MLSADAGNRALLAVHSAFDQFQTVHLSSHGKKRTGGESQWSDKNRDVGHFDNASQVRRGAQTVRNYRVRRSLILCSRPQCRYTFAAFIRGSGNHFNLSLEHAFLDLLQHGLTISERHAQLL
jgi:hypothetical protein